MKREYIDPQLQITEFDNISVITVSSVDAENLDEIFGTDGDLSGLN